MEIEHLEHDIFLLMLNLSQIKSPDRIQALFLEAMNSFWDHVEFRFAPAPERTDGVVIDIATIRYVFGHILVEGRVRQLQAEELAVIRNAVSMLAILLETSAQAKVLADENLRLDMMVQERTSELQHETQAHQEARKKILQYADIVGKMPIGLHLYQLEDPDDDRTLRMISANAAAVEITGIPFKAIIGKTLDDIFPNLREAGIPQQYAEVVRTGRSCTMHNLRYADDRIKPAIFSMKAVPIAGRCVAALFEDVTERKRAEEERDRFFRFSMDLLTVAGFDGILKQVNPAWERALGWKEAELQGAPWLAFVHADDRAATQEAGRRLRQGQPVTNFENRYRCKDGTYRWLSWNAFPLPDEDSIFAVARDITDLKRAERALRDLNAELEDRVSQRTADLKAINAELEQFAYMVSHDLKAPLRGIGHLADWLHQDYAAVLDEQGQEMLNLLSGRVQRLDRLIDGILQYSRTGRTDEAVEAIDTRALLLEVLDMLAPPDHIRVELAPSMPTVAADRSRIIQIFQNLLSNAIRFMDKPEGRISIQCEDRGDAWLFRVADNGPGIDPKYHDRVFHIFQTLTPHDTSDSTGIGLTLVKRIVEHYHGTIWVEPAPSQGAVFAFTFPKYGVSHDEKQTSDFISRR